MVYFDFILQMFNVLKVWNEKKFYSLIFFSNTLFLSLKNRAITFETHIICII